MSATSLKSRYCGALLGVAVGDALGAPFEGNGAAPSRQLRSLVSNPHRLRYTDDTHMTIGVGESLVRCRGFDGEHMTRLFARNYAAEPWRGYGSGPPQIFQAILEGACWDEPARELFGGRGSYGNGAAMRVAPVALFGREDLEQVARIARETARITHAHDLGVEGAVLQSCAIALLLTVSRTDFSPSDFLAALRPHLRMAPYKAALTQVEQLADAAAPREVAKQIGNDITAITSVPAALCCFLRNTDSFSDAVLFAISLGGDTDTIASMTGALSGAFLGDAAIPTVWRDRVEGGEQLRQIAVDLLNLRSDPV